MPLILLTGIQKNILLYVLDWGLIDTLYWSTVFTTVGEETSLFDNRERFVLTLAHMHMKWGRGCMGQKFVRSCNENCTVICSILIIQLKDIMCTGRIWTCKTISKEKITKKRMKYQALWKAKQSEPTCDRTLPRSSGSVFGKGNLCIKMCSVCSGECVS